MGGGLFDSLPPGVLLQIVRELPVEHLVCVHEWRSEPCGKCKAGGDSQCALPLTCEELREVAESEELWHDLLNAEIVKVFSESEAEDLDRMMDVELAGSERTCSVGLSPDIDRWSNVNSRQLPVVNGQRLSYKDVYRWLVNTTFPVALDLFGKHQDAVSSAAHGWEIVSKSSGVISWSNDGLLGSNRSAISSKPFNLTELEQACKGVRPTGMLCLRTEEDSRGTLHCRVKTTNAIYFEVTILGPSDALSESYIQPCVCVGFTDDPGEIGTFPGWSPSSYAFHSDDGKIHYGRRRSKRIKNVRFGVGDTIGCGIRFKSQQREKFEMFFTRNGEMLGERAIFLCVSQSLTDKQKLYPIVGVDASRIVLKCNFGWSPFLFDPDENFARLSSRLDKLFPA